MPSPSPSWFRTVFHALALSGLSALAAPAQIVIDDPLPAPLFSPASGTFEDTLIVHMVSATPGASILYTLDGTTPTLASPRYMAPIVLTMATTVKAIAVTNGQRNSMVATAIYTRASGAVAMPVASPPGGTFATPVAVSLSTPTAGAFIYYTLDGTLPDPTGNSILYDGPIVITRSTTVRSIAMKLGLPPSAVRTDTYTLLDDRPLAPPIMAPAGGSFLDSIRIRFAVADTGGRIHYTLDGSDPTVSSPVYGGQSLLLRQSATVKAIAVLGGRQSRAVIGYFQRFATGVSDRTSPRPLPARFHPRWTWERDGRGLDGALR